MSANVIFSVSPRALPSSGRKEASIHIGYPGLVYRNVQISVRYAAFKRHPE